MTHQVHVPGIGTPDDALYFPDSMSQDEITAAIKKHPNYKLALQQAAGGGQPQQGQPTSFGQKLSDAADAVGGGVDEGLMSIGSGAIKGLTGLAGTPGLIERGVDWGLDKAVGALTGKTPEPMKSHLFKTPEEIQGMLGKAGEDYTPPSALGKGLQTVTEFTTGALGGEAGNIAKVVRGIPEAAPTLLKSLAKWGVIPGSLAEAGKGADKTVGGEGSVGELVGAIAGTATAAGLHKIPGLAARTIQSFKQEATSLFEWAKRQNIAIHPQFLSDATKNVLLKAQQMNHVPGISGNEPRVHNAITELVRIADQHMGARNPFGAKAAHSMMIHGNPVGFAEFDKLQDLFHSAAVGSQNPREKAIAMSLKRELAKSFRSLRPKDVLSGNPTQAVRAWKRADALWGFKAKGEAIQELFDTAEINAGGKHRSDYTNQLLNEFRKGVKDKEWMKQFSPVEQQKLKEIILKPERMPEKILEWLAAFSLHGKLNLLSATAAGAGAVAHMGIGAAPLGAGMASEMIQKLLLQHRAKQISEMVRGGTPARRIPPPASAATGLAGGLGASQTDQPSYGGGQ